MENLTARQQQVFDFITEYLDTHSYPPTMKEIAEHIGVVGNTTVIHYLEALERKGHIRRELGSSRGIIVTARTGGKLTTGTVPIPIVGTVRAGQPEPAIEDIEGYYSVDPSWIRGRTGCFFLWVKGYSMIRAGILHKDLALIAPQQTADNRDIVVASVDGDVTLKRFFREHDHIRLQPENDGMEPFIVREGEAEALIIGKLLTTIRFYN